MSDPADDMTDQTDDSAAPAAPADDAGGSDSTTVVTICKEAGGGYVVYAGEKPDDSQGEEGADMGAQGTPADSVGAALKAALDILKADDNGGAQADFQSGYDGGSNASPPKAPAAQPPMG